MTKSICSLFLIIVALIQIAAADDTTVRLYSFEFVEETGRPGHTGFFPIPGNPPPGPAQAVANLLGPYDSADFRLVDTSGNTLASIDMMFVESLGFYGTVTLPNLAFRVIVSGLDESGTEYEISPVRLFQAQDVAVGFKQRMLFVESGVVTVEGTITNLSGSGEFSLIVYDNKGYDIAVSEVQLSLNKDEVKAFEVSLDLPHFPPGVETINVSAEVQGNENEDLSNSASLELIVRRSGLFLDGFE